MRHAITPAALSVLLLSAACHRAPQQSAPTAAAATQIAWREGDVEDAFAEARETNKPVLLYWGAKWCPPCNLMKQTLFKDPAFIAQTRNFIAVHLDGDAKGAQVWGEKFGIAGYPTVIVLRPDRSEVTRLSGGGTVGTLAQVLQLAATRASSTEDLLRRAEVPSKLSADDWRLLANFDWMNDPKHVDDQAKGAALVAKLATAAPDPAMARHFALTALWMGASDTATKLTSAQLAQVRRVLPGVLASYAETKANREELAYGAPAWIIGLPDPAERKLLGNHLIAAMDRLAGDESIPLGDRLDAVNADIALAKGPGGKGKVPPGVLAKVRERVAMADRAATDPQMRQAVMPSASQMLADAGDPAAGEALLKKELPHAIAPYYFMVDLAYLAEQRDDTKAAIGWLRQAAQSADGPATRIQWAVMYSTGAIRMAPNDKATVEQAAGMVIDALGANTAGYAQRTQKRMGDWARTLRRWSAKHDGGEVFARLRTRLAKTCAVNSGCQDVLKA